MTYTYDAALGEVSEQQLPPPPVVPQAPSPFNGLELSTNEQEHLHDIIQRQLHDAQMSQGQVPQDPLAAAALGSQAHQDMQASASGSLFQHIQTEAEIAERRHKITSRRLKTLKRLTDDYPDVRISRSPANEDRVFLETDNGAVEWDLVSNKPTGVNSSTTDSQEFELLAQFILGPKTK